MDDAQQLVILEDDVYALTAKAQKELEGAGTSLTPSELEVLVLIDGKATAGETVERVRTLDRANALKMMRMLAQAGMIELVRDQVGSLDFVDFFATKGPSQPSAEAMAKAKKASAATALLLQQRGYVVRIARRANAKRELAAGQSLSIIVVEDEAHLASLLKHVLEAEGFKVRCAANRAEIVSAFRQPPRPALVLLDVVLPDADGFDVLLKIRQHPEMRTLPVMMLTAKATRDAVLNGLAGGANGYITKPFDIEVLVKAVNAVLGLSEEGREIAANPDPWSGL